MKASIKLSISTGYKTGHSTQAFLWLEEGQNLPTSDDFWLVGTRGGDPARPDYYFLYNAPEWLGELVGYKENARKIGLADERARGRFGADIRAMGASVPQPFKVDVISTTRVTGEVYEEQVELDEPEGFLQRWQRS